MAFGAFFEEKHFQLIDQREKTPEVIQVVQEGFTPTSVNPFVNMVHSSIKEVAIVVILILGFGIDYAQKAAPAFFQKHEAIALKITHLPLMQFANIRSIIQTQFCDTRSFTLSHLNNRLKKNNDSYNFSKEHRAFEKHFGSRIDRLKRRVSLNAKRDSSFKLQKGQSVSPAKQTPTKRGPSSVGASSRNNALISSSNQQSGFPDQKSDDVNQNSSGVMASADTVASSIAGTPIVPDTTDSDHGTHRSSRSSASIVDEDDNMQLDHPIPVSSPASQPAQDAIILSDNIAQTEASIDTNPSQSNLDDISTIVNKKHRGDLLNAPVADRTSARIERSPTSHFDINHIEDDHDLSAEADQEQ